MSTQYQSSRDVPSAVLAKRLDELAEVVSNRRDRIGDEFTMRIPAECDRDADLVMAEAASRLRSMSGLVEAASTALAEIESLMQEAHNNAYPVCCGRPGSECCGSPEPEWSEADQRTMDRLAPHQRSLTDALSAYREQQGDAP